MSDQEQKGAGKAVPTAIRGQKREVPGEEVYIEVRGPANKGLGSTVPYRKVLPSYKSRADQAINKQQIPPAHRNRVKKYFESLLGEG